MTEYPPNTLSLPYACDDAGCGCGAPYSTERHQVVPHFVGGAWEVSVFRTGMLVDVFRSHELNEGLVTVHECYPAAHFDPEA